MFTKIFIPLFFVTFFLANYTLAQGGMLMPSTWPVETNDTVFRASVNGWTIIKHTVPQGSVKWTYSFSRGYKDSSESYYYSTDQKLVYCNPPQNQLVIVTLWDGGTTTLPGCPFQTPPIPVETIKWENNLLKN